MKKRRKGRRRRMSRNWTMEAGLYHPADPEREVRLDDYVRGFASRVTTVRDVLTAEGVLKINLQVKV